MATNKAIRLNIILIGVIGLLLVTQLSILADTPAGSGGCTAKPIRSKPTRIKRDLYRYGQCAAAQPAQRSWGKL